MKNFIIVYTDEDYWFQNGLYNIYKTNKSFSEIDNNMDEFVNGTNQRWLFVDSNSSTFDIKEFAENPYFNGKITELNAVES